MLVRATALIAALFAVPTANGAVETHAIPYTYSLAKDGESYPKLMLPGFDEQNGARQLTRVEVRVQSEISASISIENKTDGPLAGWQLDAQHTVLTGLERQNPETFGPFAFLGGLNIAPFSATLDAADNVDGGGNDFLLTSDTTSIDSMLEMESSYLDFFRGGGEMLAVVGPFTEYFLEGAAEYDDFLGTGDAVIRFTDLTQVGTFSLIYTYDVVPEPASAAFAVMAMARWVRRQRA